MISEASTKAILMEIREGKGDLFICGGASHQIKNLGSWKVCSAVAFYLYLYLKAFAYGLFSFQVG